MNPVSDLRNSTRISLLCLTIACVASMAIAAGATKSETGILQVSPNGDNRETIVRALRGLRAPKSFRMRQEWSSTDRRATAFVEVVKPDCSHTTQNNNEETIVIGEKGYSRKGKGPWLKFTVGMTVDVSVAPQSDIHEQIKSIEQVKFIGADTLDGVSVLAYEYEQIDASGKKIAGQYRIWIGSKDGLAYRTESETQCRAQDWGGKPGDAGLIPIKVVTTYYDYNADIIIELPQRAAREAAEHWLKLADSRRYSESWAEAASVLKERYSEEAWEKRLNGFAEQASALGPINPRELMSLQTIKVQTRDYKVRDGVLLTYEGQLEKLGHRSQCLELVLDTDQVWRVFDYTEVVTPGVDGSTARNSGGPDSDVRGGLRDGMGCGTGGGMGVGPRDTADGPETSRPILLNNPKVRYTEQARNNKIQGNVTLRVLVGVDGLVRQVRVVRGLPDGLDEQAIQSAYQRRFKPAMKGGVPVAFWLPIVFRL